MNVSSSSQEVASLHWLLTMGGHVAIHALARSMEREVEAARGWIELLRAAGCVFDEHPQRGIRLIEAGLGVWADYIESRHAAGLGRKLHVYRQTASTQDVARQLIAGRESAEAVDGHVVIADHQTGGRGRLGRRWVASPGGTLLLTAIVTRNTATDERLMLASCVATARVIEALVGVACEIRWPNDVYVEGRKIAGILIERAGRGVMIGIGLNVGVEAARMPEAIRESATSLAMEGAAVDRLVALDLLLSDLDEALTRATDEQLLEAWRGRCDLLQKRVSLDADGRRLVGRVLDLDPQAGLLVQLENGAVVKLESATTSLVAESG